MKKFTGDGRRALSATVGEGVLTGKMTVDQVYAHVQHDDLHPNHDGSTTPMKLNHPRGGEAKYISRPFFERYRDYMDNLADSVLDGRLIHAMAENMEDLSDQVMVRAPLLRGKLRTSGNPQVYDGDFKAYDRPPISPREDRGV